MYGIARKLLFTLKPETSHNVALECLGVAQRLGLLKLFRSVPSCPVQVMGLNFPNPVGLAAGLDKNGDYVNALGALGFGFVEIGTVTPKAQPGNAKPRLFRLPEQNAIINRMGFNNKGMNHLVAQVKSRHFNGVLGINIGKNKVTEQEHALDDYLAGMDAVYSAADYITINISSPNTPGLRNLQFGADLDHLLAGIKARQTLLAERFERYVPVAVKVAPDMSQDEVKLMASSFLECGIDGIIATNTTTARKGVECSLYAHESGGLSGAPVREQANRVIEYFAQAVDGKIPIIGVGGVMCGADVQAKIDAGAQLVQLYSGFIYRGPVLIDEAVSTFKRNV